MFANADKDDISDMVIYQENMKLKIDSELINKIIGDITGKTDYFQEKNLRVYIDKDKNIQSADIREY